MSCEAYCIEYELPADESQQAVQLATNLKDPPVEVLKQLAVENRDRYSLLVEIQHRK